jgi:hypothetical protein
MIRQRILESTLASASGRAVVYADRSADGALGYPNLGIFGDLEQQGLVLDVTTLSPFLRAEIIASFFFCCFFAGMMTRK